MKRRAALRIVPGLPLGLLHLAAAQASTFPERPFRLVFPFTAGGSKDTVGCLIAQAMEARCARVLGNDLVAKAPAGGCTLLLAGSGSFLISSLVQPRLPYNPERDFAPVGFIGTHCHAARRAERRADGSRDSAPPRGERRGRHRAQPLSRGSQAPPHGGAGALAPRDRTRTASGGMKDPAP